MSKVRDLASCSGKTDEVSCIFGS